MIQQIIIRLKGELSQKLTADYGLSEDKIDEALSLAEQDIIETIKEEVGQGNLNGLFAILQEKEQMASNPIVMQIIRKYAGDLDAKLGLEAAKADSIAGFAIPFILRKFQEISQENGLDLGGLMAMLSGSPGNPGTTDKM